MNILMVLDHEFPPDVRVENEMESLAEAGHKVHIACFTRKKNRKKTEKINAVTIHRKFISTFIYKTSVGCLKFPFYFNYWRRYLNRLFQIEKFNVIHIHDLPLAKIGHEFSKRHNIPLVIDLHENWPALIEKASHTNTFSGRLLSSNRQWRNYEKKILQKAEVIIAVVEEMKQRLIKFGIDEKKIIIISNTLNLDMFPLPDKQPDPNHTTLFYAGGLNIHRGIQTVIQSLVHIVPKIPNIRLWLVGEGSFRKELVKLVDRLNLKKYVVFFGWKPYDKMISLLSQTDIALIPHIKSDHTDSTIPHKLFQYMYAQKPIVASNCLPIERFIKETKTGLIYKSNDPVQLSGCIINLIKNKDKFSFLQKNGKKWVKEKYNWDVDKKQLTLLYNELS